MALTVYLVDNLTRLVLPDSQWSFNVREQLSRKGHTLTSTDEPADQVQFARSEEEMARVHALLDQFD